MSNVALLPFAGLIIGGWIGVEVYEHLCNEELMKAGLLQCIGFAGGGGIAGLVIGYFSMLKLEKD